MAERRTDRLYDHVAHYMTLPRIDRIAAFAQWAREAMPRRQCVYHEGHLLSAKRLHPIARIAIDLCRQGVIRLTQFRVAEDHYLYVATKNETVERTPYV